MYLITKELAEAVVDCFAYREGLTWTCSHCAKDSWFESTIEHTPECIVTRAKLLLEQEWGSPENVVEILKNKGSGEWHVCKLDNRIWRGVDDQWFRKKKDAIRWAENNGYAVKGD